MKSYSFSWCVVCVTEESRCWRLSSSSRLMENPLALNFSHFHGILKVKVKVHYVAWCSDAIWIFYNSLSLACLLAVVELNLMECIKISRKEIKSIFFHLAHNLQYTIPLRKGIGDVKWRILIACEKRWKNSSFLSKFSQ